MSTLLDVLIVDDEPKICQVLEQILTARGCRVRLAHDGLEGLAQFKQKPADVVITDIKMPKLTGLELLRELKHRDPLLSIVIITAYPSVDGAVDAMKQGACGWRSVRGGRPGVTESGAVPPSTVAWIRPRLASSVVTNPTSPMTSRLT